MGPGSTGDSAGATRADPYDADVRRQADVSPLVDPDFRHAAMLTYNELLRDKLAGFRDVRAISAGWS
jgi:hypothetical protein